MPGQYEYNEPWQNPKIKEFIEELKKLSIISAFSFYQLYDFG